MNQEVNEILANIQSLDDALQIWTVVKTKERQMNWFQGDLLAALLNRFGESETVYGQFASVGWGAKAHLKQVVRVAKAFPDEEERLPEVGWSVYRAVYNASTRTKELPFDILTKALENNWGIKEINRYGKPPDDVIFEMSGECPTCGAVFAIRTTEFIPGEIKCPVCALKGEDTVVGELSRKE